VHWGPTVLNNVLGVALGRALLNMVIIALVRDVAYEEKRQRCVAGMRGEWVRIEEEVELS